MDHVIFPLEKRSLYTKNDNAWSPGRAKLVDAPPRDW